MWHTAAREVTARTPRADLPAAEGLATVPELYIGRVLDGFTFDHIAT